MMKFVLEVGITLVTPSADKYCAGVADWLKPVSEGLAAEANSLAAGPLNSSGPDDLVAGEENATGPGNRTQAGVVRVFFGSHSLPAVWDTRVPSASRTTYGAAPNQRLAEWQWPISRTTASSI